MRFTLRALAAQAVMLAAAPGATALAAPPTAAVGPAPHRIAGSARIGGLAGASPLRVEVMLKPRDPAALDSFLAALNAAGSPAFHRYLAPGEFGARFGASPATIAAVTRALQAAGLTPGPVSANHLTIPVAAPAATIAAGLHVGFDRYRLSTGRQVYVNTAPPQLPASVAGAVQGVLGLNDVLLEHRALSPPAGGQAAVAPPSACAAAQAVKSSPSHGDSYLTVDQVAKAYGAGAAGANYAAGYAGQGVTVAVYELEANVASDVGTYESCFGASAPVSYRQIDGGPALLDLSNADGLETELDIDNVVGVAPQSRVVVYQGPNGGTGSSANGPLDTYQAIVDQDVAQVITSSWGLCEPQAAVPDTSELTAENTIFQQAAAQGQTVFAAAGDNGSEDCSDPAGNPVDALAVDDPASQPFVTGVGGTRLTVNSSGQTSAETVWNDSTSQRGAGGGGISTIWPMPAYQHDALSTNGQLPASPNGLSCSGSVSAYCREVPDVTANADPASGYVVYWDHGWTHVGGTSGAAPLWAGFAALANSCAATQGAAPVGFLNPQLYPLSTSTTDYPNSFRDITSANNDYTGDQPPVGNTHDYTAGSLYDMASGLGSPNLAGTTGLSARLCAAATPAGTPTTASVSPGAGPQAGGSTVTIGGAGFTPGASVSFGSAVATGVQVLSYNQLTAIAPAGGGSVAVTVTTAAGTSNAQTFVYQAPAPPPPPVGGSTATGPTTQTSTPVASPPFAPVPLVPPTVAAPTAAAPSTPAAAVTRSGTLVVALRQVGRRIRLGTATCPSACRVGVRAFTLVAASGARQARRRRTSVGTPLDVRVATGAKRSLTFTLNRQAQRLLSRLHRVRLTIAFTVFDAAGHRRTISRGFVVRA